MLNWIWAGLLLCMCGVLLLAVVMLHFRRKASILAANYPIASLYALRKAARANLSPALASERLSDPAYLGQSTERMRENGRLYGGRIPRL